MYGKAKVLEQYKKDNAIGALAFTAPWGLAIQP